MEAGMGAPVEPEVSTAEQLRADGCKARVVSRFVPRPDAPKAGSFASEV